MAIDRVLASRRRCRPTPASRTMTPTAARAASKSPTSSRSSSSATTGVISSPHRLVVLLDAQEVEQQRQIERAQRRRRHRAQPRGHAVRRIVADLLDLRSPCVRAPRQLAAVLVGDERLRPSTTSAASARRDPRRLRTPRCSPSGDAATSSCASASSRSRCSSSRTSDLKRLGEAIGRTAFGRDDSWRTKRAIVPSDIRLTTAFISSGTASPSARCASMPISRSGVS